MFYKAVIVTMAEIETLRKHLEKFGQEHLLKFWDEIDEKQRQQLKYEIDELNLSELHSFIERVSTKSDITEKLDDKLRPIEESQFLSIRSTSSKLIDQYESIGLEQISAGHVGVLLMAGG